jgi:hypothetical protein
MGDGSFKTVEIEAEATLNPEEDYHEAQVALYHELGDTMNYVFSGNGAGKSHNGPPKAVQPLTAAPRREHWCSTHQTEYKMFTKEGRTWYSHKTRDGWCKES